MKDKETSKPIKFNGLSLLEKIILTLNCYFFFATGMCMPIVTITLISMVNSSIIAQAQTVGSILSALIVYIFAQYTMRQLHFKLFKVTTIIVDLLILFLAICYPSVILYWMFYVVAKIITQIDNTSEGTIMLNFFDTHKRRVDFDITERKYTVIFSVIGSIIAIFTSIQFNIAMTILISSFCFLNIKDIYMSKYLP